MPPTQPYAAGPHTGGWPPSAAPTPKKRRRWPWIAGGAVLLLVVISALSSRGGSNSTTAASTTSTATIGAGAPTVVKAPAPAPAPAVDPGPAAAAPAAAGHAVTYRVTGRGSGLVTYMKEGFSQEQVNGARLPWSKDLTFQDDITAFSGLSLVAQHSSGSGDITCAILVDGKQVAESTSSGPYAVVTCNGTHA